MKTPLNTPPPPPATSRWSWLAMASLLLAIAGFVFAGLSFLPCSGVWGGLPLVFRDGFLPDAVWLLCPLCAIGLGMAALVAIRKSAGRLGGKGLVAGTFAIPCVIVSVLLIGMEFHPVSTSTVNRARAQNMIQSLGTASKAYHNEYGHWPQPQSSGDLMLIFNGLIDPRTGKDVGQTRPDLLQQNPRRIQFIEFQAKHVTLHGQPQAELAFYDPWGTPYAFAFDNGVGGVYYLGPGTTNAVPWRDDKADDGTISEPFAATNTTSGVIHAGFAFFSNGPDKKTGTASNGEDDIRSWK